MWGQEKGHIAIIEKGTYSEGGGGRNQWVMEGGASHQAGGGAVEHMPPPLYTLHINTLIQAAEAKIVLFTKC